MQERLGDWPNWLLLLHWNNIFGFDSTTTRRCLWTQVANYRLPIHSTSSLHLVFLYEYTGGGLLLFSAYGFGLWRLNIDQCALPLGILNETAPGNSDDSRLDS